VIGRSDLALHLVTDDRVPFAKLLGVVDAAIDGGVSLVQLRDKQVSGHQLLTRAVELSAMIGGRVPFLVNDQLDVALAARGAGAHIDGVHLGQSDVAPTTARGLLGPGAIVGWTANTPEHLAAATLMPAGTLDYLGVGVIRATRTKPDHPPALGITGFGVLAEATHLPCVAIGGVKPADVGPLRRAGAAGVAVVSAICTAVDPESAARVFAGEGDR
jgi:thiamine-phosphate pyrophosphorylase